MCTIVLGNLDRSFFVWTYKYPKAHPYREQKLGCKTDPQLFFRNVRPYREKVTRKTKLSLSQLFIAKLLDKVGLQLEKATLQQKVEGVRVR